MSAETNVNKVKVKDGCPDVVGQGLAAVAASLPPLGTIPWAGGTSGWSSVAFYEREARAVAALKARRGMIASKNGVEVMRFGPFPRLGGAS